MNWQTWYTIVVVVLMVIAFWRNYLSTEFTALGGLIALMAAGVIDIPAGLKGFSHSGMLTVAALFVVAGAMQYTGALVSIAERFLGRVASETTALIRLILPASLLSPFLNNTPIVAIFTPIVRDWAKRNDISPSKLLIPLSYATILGGMCTLIGTSTNLVVNGMMIDRGEQSMKLFELAGVGIPCLVTGVLYILLVGRHLLPARKALLERLDDERREYVVEMKVDPGSVLAGKTIAGAGLRHLKGLFLAELERGGKLFAPVSPNEQLQEGDRLVFFGITSTIVELQKIKGISPAADRHYNLTPGERQQRKLYEVVVSPRSPLNGMNIRESNFRRRYEAVVIAVHRNGIRLNKKIGDIIIRPGDTLLLEGTEGFAHTWYNSTDFYLVSELSQQITPHYEKAPLALIIMTLMVVTFAIWPGNIVLFAFGAAFILIVLKCITPAYAKQSIDLSVLLVIAAAIGIGTALEQSGAADMIARGLLRIIKPLGPIAALAAIYGLTTFFTEIISNNAAAAMIIPVAFSTAAQLEVSPRPFAIAVAVAASASFATPIGYQTNLIVYGPGGYTFSDFIKVGLPLNIMMWIVAVTVIPCIWSF